MSLTLADVAAARERIARAHALAAERFREAFAAGGIPPERHLEFQAAALVECAAHTRVRGTIRYDVADRLITPYVERGQPLFPFFEVERTPAGVFEYWLIVSEILASPAWSMTRVIAGASEYDEALRRMRSPQLVRAIPPPLLPSVEIREDGTALLDVTVYTRAGEERIERRTLALDRENEFSFHGRVLIAEAR